MQDLLTLIQTSLRKLENRTHDIRRIRDNLVLFRCVCACLLFPASQSLRPPSPDTWEYELSHVIDIYADDFVHRSLVALTSWPEVPEQDKIKAFNLLVGFVNELIERVGIHSLRSSTYGLNPDNMNLNYRSCQRAGSVTVAVVGFFRFRLLLALLLLRL